MTTAVLPTAEVHARRQKWNRGQVGTPTPPRYTSPVTEPCYTENCGRHLDDDELGADGWILALVCGSSEPARWWCSRRCAGRGIALAELRHAPDAPEPPARPADDCPEGCGDDFHPSDPARTGWVLTCHFHDTTGQDTTWWCSGGCAAAGLAILTGAGDR